MIPSALAAAIGDAVTVDEIGLRSADCRGFRLRTTYQPVFAAEGERLWPVAAAAGLACFRRGEPVSLPAFHAALAPGEAAFADRLARVLHIANHASIPLPGLALVLGLEHVSSRAAGDWEDEIAQLAQVAQEAGLDLSAVICLLSSFGQEPGLPAEMAQMLRRRDFGLGLDAFGDGAFVEGWPEGLIPDLVRLGMPALRRMRTEPGTLRLLAGALQELRRAGSHVLVDGIGEAADFALALEAGADLFQGDHLAAAAPAGSDLDAAPLEKARLLPGDAKVLPLFAGLA